MFANAADAARRIQYRPVVALSAGYDFPAAAVIAHEAGCTEGFTFGQPFDRPDIDEDSGAAIGRTIALSMKEYRTYAYRDRSDLPEIEFIASSFAGGQVYLTAADGALSERLVVSGYGGDKSGGGTTANEIGRIFLFTSADTARPSSLSALRHWISPCLWWARADLPRSVRSAAASR